MGNEFRSGERIYFRPLEIEDLDFLQSLIAREELHPYLGIYWPLNRRAEREWLEGLYKNREAFPFGIVLKEGFPHWLFAGCAVAFAGCLMIGFATTDSGSSQAGLGIALLLLAAVSYSVAVVIQKPVLIRVPALEATFLACLAGTAVCLPFAGQLADQLGDASASSIGWVVYLGLGPTALGFATWAFALNRMSAGRLGSVTYLAPVVAIVLGWAILSETPPALAVIGGGLCLVGVAIARRR